MKTAILYFFVIILSNSVGALSGMGGGVIIKPVLDAIGIHSLVEISFYSSIAVFTMSIVSTLKQFKNGIKIQLKQAFFISVGSVFGGISGDFLFQKLIDMFQNENSVQMVQIILTIAALTFALAYTRSNWKAFGFKSNLVYFIVGLFLGGLSTLLGIGGLAINVALLMLCFGLSIKESTVYSIVTIFFSQFSKLLMTGLSIGYGNFDLSLLIAIIPAAICGGYIGAKLSGILSDKHVLRAYQLVIILVILLNIFNGVQIAFI